MTTIAIAKTHTLDIDLSKFNNDVNEFIFAYGLKQLLNDAGSSGKTPDEKLEMAKGKLDRLYAGELRRVGTAKTALDPVQAEAERLAWDAIKSGLKAAGRKVADVTDEQREAAIEAYIAKTPEVLKIAKRRVDERGKAQVNLDELGL